MTYVWARWVADALEARPSLRRRVVEVPGWQTRGRPPEQFSFVPSGLVCHHTACGIRVGHDPQWCADAIMRGNASTPPPIAQLLGTWTAPGTRFDGWNVDPHIIVIAAGRANHAGSGVYPWGAPSGNGSSIGIEWCGPPGEDGMWPSAVTDFYAEVVDALLAWNGWSLQQVTTHFEYGRPLGRKIDPSGPWDRERALGALVPWTADVWRARVNDVTGEVAIEVEGGAMIGLAYRTPQQVGTAVFTGFVMGEFIGWQTDGVAAALDERVVSEVVDVNEWTAANRGRLGLPALMPRQVMLSAIRSRGTVTAPPPVVKADADMLRAWRANAVTESARTG